MGAGSPPRPASPHKTLSRDRQLPAMIIKPPNCSTMRPQKPGINQAAAVRLCERVSISAFHGRSRSDRTGIAGWCDLDGSAHPSSGKLKCVKLLAYEQPNMLRLLVRKGVFGLMVWLARL